MKFAGFDDVHTPDFLKYPDLQPAVHFGCVRTPSPFEDALEQALRGNDRALRFQALVLLVSIRAPRSVDLQWKALQEIDAVGERMKVVLDEMRDCFSPPALAWRLQGEPPRRGYGTHPELEWNLRAAGVVQSRAALPRLVAFSRGDHLHASLAAEKSLEDFEGIEGDRALAQCVLGWNNAFMRAGNALLRRNPDLLREVLSAHCAPERHRYSQGLLMARCGDPEAVPILCETVHLITIVDKEMFKHIGRLARADHRPLVEQLPDRVRPEQREDALSTSRTVLERLGRD